MRSLYKRIFFITLFCFSAGSVWSQTIISGQVKDENNEGLAGVNIIVKGRVIGTITDVNGNFVPARLSLTEPFHVVGKDEMIVKMDNSLRKRVEATGADFVDGTVAGSMARQNQVEFTGDRDTYENFTMMKDAGTRNNPLYKLEPANEIDPISTMNRALSKMINSTFMEDYKIFSMTTLLQEAAPRYVKALKRERANTSKRKKS